MRVNDDALDDDFASFSSNNSLVISTVRSQNFDDGDDDGCRFVVGVLLFFGGIASSVRLRPRRILKMNCATEFSKN